MEATRIRLAEGVHLTYLPARKFKTSLLSAQFVTPLRRETAGANALLAAVLRRGTVSCPDMGALSAKMDNLYDASIDYTVRKKGENQCVGFVASFIDDRYAPGGERLLEPAAALLGELVCNEAICGDLLDIFRVLYDASYPIERMVLIDEYDAQDGPSMRANNSSAFNFRFVAGTGVLSSHSRGMAVDINPLYNPYVKTNGGRTVVDPAEAAPYADRTRDFPYKIAEDDPCCREFLRHGFTWGGHWKSLKDYQHFEKRR